MWFMEEMRIFSRGRTDLIKEIENRDFLMSNNHLGER